MESEALVFKRSVFKTGSFIVAIWLVKIIEYIFNLDLSSLGNYPRTLQGSMGILLSPLIHGDIYHLFSNTIPFIMLGLGLFYFYNRIALTVFVMIYLMTGFWVWIAARDAYHIGASGLVYGILTFLLVSGFMRKDRGTLAISFVVLFLYGGSFLAGVFPGSQHVSWESHLMGAVAGIFCAIYFKNYKLPMLEHKEEPDTTTTSKVPEFRYFYKPREQDHSKDFHYTVKVQSDEEEQLKEGV